MGIVIVVEACYIPIVNRNLVIRIGFSFIIHTIESGREAVVNNEAVLLGIVWEDEVSGGFQEVYLVSGCSLCRCSFSRRPFMHIVGIDIAATFVFTNVDEVHLYYAIDWSVENLVDDILLAFIV